MGVDEKYLDLMEKGVTKELNRLHDWLETEAKRITQIDKDVAVDLEKLKADLKEHVDEKIEALETKLLEAIKTKLLEAIKESGGGGLGNKEKVAIGGGVGLGALALIKHAIDMIWGSGAAG